MARQGSSQSALARQVGVDRSTISQLLRGTGARMPNAQVVGECAAALGVSADWLLSLSNRPETAADIMANSLSLTEAPRALVDEQIFEWHREAEGYKIRHVPAALPDMLKTEAMLEWEYRPHLGRTTKQAVGASADRLAWMRRANTDYEIAVPLHELTSMVRAEGYYEGLPVAIRAEQIDRFFSAPVTVFGPLLAVLYVGRNYVVFRDSARVQAFTEHCDALVREASISARETPDYLLRLRDGG